MPRADAPKKPANVRPEPVKSGGIVPVIALGLAVVALGLAGWAAFRPASALEKEPVYTDAQQAEARTAICAAVELVRKGVSLNTNLPVPGGEGDVTGSLAVAANARLALSVGGRYLLDRLEPATPKALADDVTSFGNTLMDAGAAFIAGALNTDPDQAARLQEADALNAKLLEACK